MKNIIVLSKLRFYAFHGVLYQEKSVGHIFVVTLRISCDFKKAMINDKVKDTINYGEVYEIVKSEMDKRSKLMEHLACRILHRIFTNFSSVDSVFISIIKENPPINSDSDGCGVEIEMSRTENDRLSSSVGLTY